MYKVRFHLGRGKHFMHWQIKSKLNTGDGTGARNRHRVLCQPIRKSNCYDECYPKGSAIYRQEDSRRCLQDSVCMDTV